MLPVAQILAANVERLIGRMTERPPRPQLAARMGIGDKTLGFIKAGNGNPTLESVEKVAMFFRVAPWELLRPAEAEDPRSASQPVSGEALMIAADLADEALQGLWLPKNRYFDLVALIHDGITRGLPYAQILEFARPAARELANRGKADERQPGLGAAGEGSDGGRKAAGNR